MLACAEMITMCLQSAKKKHLRAQQQHPQPQPQLRIAGQGLTIFYDVSLFELVLIQLSSASCVHFHDLVFGDLNSVVECKSAMHCAFVPH